MPVPSTRTRPSSPSRSVWWRLDEQRDHAGAALARGRAPQGRGGARVSHAGVGEVERQRADAGRLLSPAVARVAHPAAVHGDGHAGRIRRAGVVPGRRGDGPGGGDATRDRAGAVPGGRAASQEAAGAGTTDAGSAGGRAEEAGPRGSAQAVPIQQEIVEILTSLDPVLGPPRGVASEMTAAAEITHERECMAQPQLQDLLEAGVHFGHQTRRWNPKMRRFIFAERSGIYIIDLQTINKQIKQLKDLEQGTAEGEFENYTKKDLLLFDRERVKLEKYLSGI